MLNPDFPRPGTGAEALLARGLITIEKRGLHFVPPDTNGPIVAGLFAMGIAGASRWVAPV